MSTAVDNPTNPKPVWSEARKRATKVCMVARGSDRGRPPAERFPVCYTVTKITRLRLTTKPPAIGNHGVFAGLSWGSGSWKPLAQSDEKTRISLAHAPSEPRRRPVSGASWAASFQKTQLRCLSC